MRNPLHSLGKRLVRLRRFPLLARRRGAVFLLDPRNWIDNRLAAGAPFENRQIERAHALVAEHRLDMLVDAGANIGLYTVLVGRLPAITQVIAFEPVRRNFNQMLGNVFANRLDAKVEAHRLALGSAPGEVTIHIDPSSTGVARLDLTGAARDIRVFSHSETVSVARFDDVATPTGRRVLLKIDVEGHALPALAGMTQLLAGNHVVAQIELLDADRAAIIAHMSGLGFALVGEIEGDGYFAPGA